MTYETAIITIRDGGMFDTISIEFISGNPPDLKGSMKGYDQAGGMIALMNKQGWYVSAATDSKIYLTKNIYPKHEYPIDYDVRL